MFAFFNIDWRALFVPSGSLLEVALRGTMMYLVLFTLLRFALKRVTGNFGIADLLMIVLLADAAQNAMSAGYTSLTEGVVLVGTIIFWNFTLDWLGYRFPLFQRFLHPPPLPLVRDGRMLRRNMQRELITKDELMSQLREQGVEDLSQVKTASMEGDGRISVVRSDKGESQQPIQTKK